VEFKSTKLSHRLVRGSTLSSAALVLTALLASHGHVKAAEPQSVVQLITQRQRQVSPEPIRLPPIDAFLHEPAPGLEPFAFSPIARFDLFEAQGPSALSLGVGMPGDAKPSIGGWISFGYSGRGFGQ
jgi:hypothetical protein